MTETYRTTELQNAKRELAAARQKFDALRARGWSNKAADVANAVEFWGNKVAFLDAVKGE